MITISAKKRRTIFVSYPHNEEISIRIFSSKRKDEPMYAKNSLGDNDAPRFLAKKIIQKIRFRKNDLTRDDLPQSPACIFGERIYYLRQRESFSMEEFAEKAKITIDELYSLELGLMHADTILSKLDNLEHALGNRINLKRMFFDLVSPPSSPR